LIHVEISAFRKNRPGGQSGEPATKPTCAYTPCLAAWHRQLQAAFAAGLAVFRSFFAAVDCQACAAVIIVTLRIK
jgi:hypothetical protein